MTETINIDAIVFDTTGETAFEVVAWPETRPEEQVGILANGELLMTNVFADDIIVFRFKTRIIDKIPANQIGNTLIIAKTHNLDPVLVVADESKINIAFKILGLLGIVGLGYVMFSDESKKVSL
jgi:hypothetical protein